MAFPYKAILCPVDFDENSLAVLDKALEIARQLGSSILLVRVIQLFIAYGELPPPVTYYEDQKKVAQARLDNITKEKLAGLKHEAVVYNGDVIASILHVQTQRKPDLVVMATHGRRGLARMFLGSVTEAVVRKATCPVLTIREEVSAA